MKPLLLIIDTLLLLTVLISAYKPFQSFSLQTINSSKQTMVIPATFVIVRDEKLVNFRNNLIAKYFFRRIIGEMNYIVSHLDSIGEDSSCLYNDWLQPANTLLAPRKLPVVFVFKDIVVIQDNTLANASNFKNCGSALHYTYRPEIVSKIPQYDSSSIYVFAIGSSCWERKISEGKVVNDCKDTYNNGGKYQMCAMSPPSKPMAIHIMTGALRLHYQDNKPSLRRIAGSLLHEVFHWAGLGHTKGPNGIMNPSGKAKRQFLNIREQQKVINTMQNNKAWKLITVPTKQ